MPIFGTPTPPYAGQRPDHPARPLGLRDWFTSLFRTPTPTYHTAPTHNACRAVPAAEPRPVNDNNADADPADKPTR